MNTRNMDKKDKKGLIVCLIFGPLLLFGAWGSFIYHQDEQLPGIIDYKNGHTQKAILELQQYNHDHPCAGQHAFLDTRAYSAQEYLGRAYLDTKQNQKAVAVFSDPCMEGSVSEYSLGIALMRLGRLEEARAAFKKCMRVMPRGKSFNEALYDAAQAKLDMLDKLR